MKFLFSILFLAISITGFTSCSLYFGGLVSLDNAFYKGEKEISYDKLVKMEKGDNIILQLADSSKISGTFKGLEKTNNLIPKENILILDSENKLNSVKINDVKKYFYVDDGGSVWTAVAIGAVIDASIVLAFKKGGTTGIKVF